MLLFYTKNEAVHLYVDLRSLFTTKKREAAIKLFGLQAHCFHVTIRLLQKCSMYVTRKSKQHWHLLLDILIADCTKAPTFRDSCEPEDTYLT